MPSLGLDFRRLWAAASVARFAALGGVPAAMAFGVLTYPLLCTVTVVQTAGPIVFNTASGAHLKNPAVASRLHRSVSTRDSRPT